MVNCMVATVENLHFSGKYDFLAKACGHLSLHR